MTALVLIHGAWHGGWSWRRTEHALATRAPGLPTWAVTLTGLGERAHLSESRIDLSTHVEDVVRMVEFEDLRDVVLVAHSYAGMVGVPAAARLGDRIAQLIVVDGFVAEEGEQAIDLLPPAAAHHYRTSARPRGTQSWIPPRPLANLGVTDPEAAAWLEPRLTDHPLQTYLDGAPVGASELNVPGAYVLCTGWNSPFVSAAERASSLGWAVRELDADHEALATAPYDLADVVLELAGEPLTAPQMAG